MKIELTFEELRLIQGWAPSSFHPSTQALKRKINNIVAAAEVREGNKYIERDKA